MRRGLLLGRQNSGPATGGRIIAANKAAQGLVADAENLSEADQAKAHNALSDAVLAGTVRHGNESALNTAVRGPVEDLRQHAGPRPEGRHRHLPACGCGRRHARPDDCS
jgi:hypothetical protein